MNDERKHPPFHARRADFRSGEGGFTLVESMVSLAIMSFGLLGIAVMQTMALGKNVDANELSLATNLTADMLERIQYNRQNVTAYNGIDTNSSATKPSSSSQPTAAGDYDQWSARLTASRLASIRGRITVVATGPTNLGQQQVTVQVTWVNGIVPHTVSLGIVIAPE